MKDRGRGERYRKDEERRERDGGKRGDVEREGGRGKRRIEGCGQRMNKGRKGEREGGKCEDVDSEEGRGQWKI